MKIKNLLFSFLILPMVVQAQTVVQVDYSRWEEYPLVKKIGLYQTPLTCREWLQRDLPKLSDLNTLAFRYEIAWGKDDLYGQPGISGSKNNLQYNFEPMDYLFDMAYENAPVLIFSHGYSPTPIKQNYNWMNPPSDLSVWGAINKKWTEHWREKDYHNDYVEVWNEPDLTNVFFTAGFNEYKDIYQFAAPAIKEGDSDIKVGGPVGAGTGWNQQLVDYVKSNALPLDFLSGHAYGGFENQVLSMRNALISYNHPSTEMILSEYSPYGGDNIRRDGLVEQAEAAMTFFEQVKKMLTYTDLTYVTWAQFIDPGAGNPMHTLPKSDGDKMGIIDGDLGVGKALYNAFKIYGELPEKRARLISGGSLDGFASSDDSQVAAVVWNKDYNDQQLSLTLNNIPFDKGRLEVYHVDAKNNSYYETSESGLVTDKRQEVEITNGRYRINDKVATRGIIFVRIIKDGANTGITTNNVAKVIKTHYHYTHTGGSAYGYFNPRRWEASLSTNSENGWGVVGVTTEGLPDVVRLSCKTTSNLADESPLSTLNFRIDYQSNDGKYKHAVVWHQGIYHAESQDQPLWGTGTSATKAIQLDNLDHALIDIKSNAPKDFSGRAIITFQIDHTGKNTRAIFRLTDDNQTLISNVQTDSIVDNKAFLSSSIDGDTNGISSTGFLLSQQGDPLKDNAIDIESELNGRNFSASTNRLSSKSNNYIRAYVVDDRGKRIYSPLSMFRIPADKAIVYTYSPTLNASKTNATFRGRVSNDNGSQVYENGFVWMVNHSGNNIPTINDNVVPVSSGNNLFTYSLRDLDGETDYVVRAYAKNDGGIAYGQTHYFSTKAEGGITDGIEAVNTLKTRAQEEEYDISGIRIVSNKERGVVIIRKADGKTKKYIKRK